MNYLIKLFIIILLFSTKINAVENENKIIFSINEKVFTNIDLERRITYIGLLNNIDFTNINESNKIEILDDFISALIFFEYYLIRDNKNIISTDDINNFYNKNFLTNNTGKVLNDLDSQKIKSNIKIDLIRKKITENILNSNKDLLDKKSDILDILYNYNLNYIILN